MSELSEYENLSLKKLDKAIRSGLWSDEGLVQLIELEGAYLNVMSVPDYSKAKKISDVAARKDTFYRKNRTIFNTKYVIDNY